MPEIGPMEILVVAIVALIVFGPERLPEMARKAGRLMTDVRRISGEMRSEFETTFEDDDDHDFDDPSSKPAGPNAPARPSYDEKPAETDETDTPSAADPAGTGTK